MAAVSHDRIAGCVLGLFLGDALGAPFESRRAAQIPDPLPALELPWRGRPPGTGTDVTAMARTLVRSLTDRGRFDPGDVAARHLAWLGSSPDPVDSTVRRVLGRVAAGIPAATASRAVWEERGPEVSAGNGSVKYCAPLGMAYARTPEKLDRAGPALSAITHHDERCGTAVVAVTRAAAELVAGAEPLVAVRRALAAVRDRAGAEELEFLTSAVGLVRSIDGPDRRFCLFAAAAGLQSLTRPLDLAAALPRVVALGGDTSANAAVAGALLGAHRGRSDLPQRWVARLHDREALEAEAEGLADVFSATLP